MVEFALVVPVFLLLALGIADVARAQYAAAVLVEVTREAARQGALGLSEPGWQTTAVQAGRARAVGLDQALLDLSVVELEVDGRPHVSATASYSLSPLTPAVGALLGAPLTLHASTTTLSG